MIVYVLVDIITFIFIVFSAGVPRGPEARGGLSRTRRRWTIRLTRRSRASLPGSGKPFLDA